MNESELFQESVEPPKQVEAYKKIKVLGQGSMGKAYLVSSNSDNQMYVMKRINIGHLPPEQQDAAMREAQLHSIVQHENIIAFKEIYHTTKQKLCIIMEYADNGDLDEFIQSQNGKPLPEETVLQYFSQICLGLREIHSKKIIHRDIKGANIFLNKENIVKIGDFGISKIIDQTIQASKSFVGTPYYLPPEMVQGKPYSTKADIWSLGVLLYNLCAQKLPFEANSLPLLALKIMKGSFPPLNGPFSRELKKLILTMLQVDQKKRPTVNEILIKPLIAKFVKKEEIEKIENDLRIKKTIPKQISTQAIKNTNTIVQGNSIKTQRKQNVKKVLDEGHKAQEKQQKEEKKKKREEEFKEMKNDIRKKKMEIQKEKTQSNKVICEKPDTFQSENSKARAKDLQKQLQKCANETENTTAKISKADEKPWKVLKNKSISKKQVPVEILVPKIRQKPIKKEMEIPPPIDFKIEIKQFGKKPQPLIPNSANFKREENESSSSENEKADQNQEDYENEQNSYEEISNEEVSEEINEGNQREAKFQDMMNQLTHAKTLVDGLKGNNQRKIQLYEQSENFDEPEDILPHPNKQPNWFERQSWEIIHNSENLQYGRQIIEEAIGQERYVKAHGILTEHIEESEQRKQSQEQTQKQIFNKEVLRQKLPFLSDWEFESYIILMYSLLIIELEEMKKNFDE